MPSKMTSEQEEPHQSEFLGVYKNVNQFSETMLRAVLQATKASNAMPSAGDEYDYYSTFLGFRQVLLSEGKRILNLMSALSNQQTRKGKFDGLELEEKFDLLTDINDVLLERINNSLDEAAGLKKKDDELVISSLNINRPISTSWNKKISKDTKPSTISLLTAKNISRPQLKFKRKIDNSNSPFIPIISDKPNSLKPLAILPEVTEHGEVFSHPYECEIEHFQPLPEHLEFEEQIPLPLEETPYIYVTKREELEKLCEDLKKQKEIAVDLEHHSYRTFQGFTCLMQISTRSSDYIVDTLELMEELHILNEVFTDPKIVKVLHGADMDIQWLQRDFGLYIVNLFDTGQAARVLRFSQFSLAFLLKHYCQVDADKKFQLADWRIRPLPHEMVKYAREDTHYLLHIYDQMKRDLIDISNEQKNLLKSVFQRSKLICLKRYEKPVYHDDSYLELYKKSKKVFNGKQLYALKHLYDWRNKTARTEDESTGYILPNHMILQIAEILPRDQQGIIACCNPCPPLVRQHLNELHGIILKARDTISSKVPITNIQQQASAVHTHIDLDNILHSYHDIPPNIEDNVGLSTLLDNEGNINREAQMSPKDPAPIKKTAMLSAFSLEDKKRKKSPKGQKARPVFISPYKRLKLANPFDAKDEEATTQDSVNDSDRVNRLYEHYKMLVDFDSKNDSIGSEGMNTTQENSMSEMDVTREDDSKNEKEEVSCKDKEETEEKEEDDNKPLRKKLNRKQRMKRKRKPNISLLVTDTPEAKKPKATQASPKLSEDVVPKNEETKASCSSQEGTGNDEKPFVPFDYSKAKLEQKKKSKNWNFDPQQQKGKDIAVGKKKSKQKKFKSWSYSGRADQKNNQTMKWPKR